MLDSLHYQHYSIKTFMINTLNLKPTHKAVKDYYAAIAQYTSLGAKHEGTVSPAFATLLKHCAGQFKLTLLEKHSMKPVGKPSTAHSISVDGSVVDDFKLPHGYWEAKDTDDDLGKEVKNKFAKGYPKDNILFQAPDRIIIWQDSQEVFDKAITQPEQIIEALKTFFEYQPPAYEQFGQAVEEFKLRVPELANGLLQLIEKERTRNKSFIQAFEDFSSLCQQTINPNISIEAIEEMLIQHLLTERIFRNVFKNADFVERNVIAHEIEKVILALTSKSFSRDAFLKSLDRFYGAIETTAATIDDFIQKQSFLNSVYEKFFQGFSVKVADTHGIVYTPQSIVSFMVKSVDEILHKEFDSALSDEGVHIIDPFVGTGNFIIHVMRELQKAKLPYKYDKELHCNEVMLLPYYISSMNIEHEFYELTGKYDKFEGICLVDTFELAEGKQLSLLTKDNTKRVREQQEKPIFVVIGNPPYNAGQVNENDNNKNRKYPAIDGRVSKTYGRESKATLLTKLNDPYIKAIRWAADRIDDEGIVAFVTNNSFVSEITFDGMRKCLERDFDAIYILDLGGNVRKNPKLSGTTHNVFGIQVGVSINLLIRNKAIHPKHAKIYYARVDEYWRKEDKWDFLDQKGSVGNISWEQKYPDKNYNWLTEGIVEGFASLLPLGTKEAKGSKKIDVKAIFKIFSLGVSTNRDSVVYDFNRDNLNNRVEHFCNNYNAEVARYQQRKEPVDVDSFVDYERLQWSSTLKNHLKGGALAEFNKSYVRDALYRPFTSMLLYYDSILNDRPALFRQIFPISTAELENCVICLSGIGSGKPFQSLMTNIIPCLDVLEKTQGFPLYTYDEDGTNRRENITDWALEQFRTHYKDKKISKLDVFHYVYAILHHLQYREKYAANLKRELPRILFTPEFWKFAKAGARLAELHVNYEKQPEYKLHMQESKDIHLEWRVEKMKLSTDKTQIAYNEFLTLGGIPAKAFEYRLGNRSALEWIVDQYQVSTDKRSGIITDPNRLDDPEYVVRLIGKVITVSLETVKIVKGLPPIE